MAKLHVFKRGGFVGAAGFCVFRDAAVGGGVDGHKVPAQAVADHQHHGAEIALNENQVVFLGVLGQIGAKRSDFFGPQGPGGGKIRPALLQGRAQGQDALHAEALSGLLLLGLTDLMREKKVQRGHGRSIVELKPRPTKKTPFVQNFGGPTVEPVGGALWHFFGFLS